MLELLDKKLTATAENVVRILSNKVAQNITEKYKNVQERMGQVMGGKVLDLDIFKILNEGKTEGRAEEHRDVINVMKMLRSGKKPNEIATLTGMSLSDVSEIEENMMFPV